MPSVERGPSTANNKIENQSIFSEKAGCATMATLLSGAILSNSPDPRIKTIGVGLIITAFGIPLVNRITYGRRQSKLFSAEEGEVVE